MSAGAFAATPLATHARTQRASRLRAPRLRCLALVVGVCGWFLLFDLLQRLALARRDAAWHERLVVDWARGLHRLLRATLGIRFEVSPQLQERARRLRGAIVVANHQSPLDIIAVLLLVPPRPLRFVARAGLGSGMPCVSAFMRQPGQVLLDPRDSARNLLALQGLGAALETDGSNALIFPEGPKTARTYASIRQFRARGLGTLHAAAPGAPIVAIAIRNSNDAWRGPGHLPGCGVTVRLELATEIDPAAAAALDDKALAESCEAAVRRVLDQPLAR